MNDKIYSILIIPPLGLFINLVIDVIFNYLEQLSKYRQNFEMSFKATVDMFVNFSYIQVRFLNRQGYLRYRIKIYMKL